MIDHMLWKGFNTIYHTVDGLEARFFPIEANTDLLIRL